MHLRRWSSLAILVCCVGSAPVAGTPVTVYRCEDGQGRVTLQDEACPAGQDQTTREMTRPRDPPPRPAAPEPEPDADPESEDFPPSQPAPWSVAYPPPPLYQCTDFDGEIRYSEDYDPNTRCVPLAVLGYGPRGSPQAASTCRWVSESCVLLDEATTCERFKSKLRQARADVLHSFSDRLEYRRSEVIRLARIVTDSCP